MTHTGGVEQRELTVRLYLLGGFRAERDGLTVPADAWPRRSAKALVKLLATTPTHRMHCEQVIDLLWPDLSPESAANALRKALHFARHVLEPTLPFRGDSAYIHLHDDVVALASDLVWVDVDAFVAAAKTARDGGSRGDFERALALYGGALLPEDGYEDWASSRQMTLADLHHTLLLELATYEEKRGEFAAAAEHLRQALAQEPSSEDVHRRLMRIYALDDRRHGALRQYRACRELLRRELDADPDPATEALYQAIVTGRIGPETAKFEASRTPQLLPPTVRRRVDDSLIGREQDLDGVKEAWRQAVAGTGNTLLVGGEAGIGKSRLVAEIAHSAHEHGACVLWGACYEQEGYLPYGPWVEAMDGPVANRSPEARDRLAADYPELVGFLPALYQTTYSAQAVTPPDANRTRLFAAIVRLLDELSHDGPLLLVLDDLHAADPAASLQLLHHIARMARQRRWLILGTFREEGVPVGSEFQLLSAAMNRAGLCRRLELQRLSYTDCGHLVTTLLAGDASEELLEHLYSRSLGNPLFLLELLRSMREQDEVVFADGQWSIAQEADTSVPRQIRELIAARVDYLGSDVRRALALVAAAGEVCSFPILCTAGELPESELLDALDRALEAQLLEERGGGYAFRHPLVRATLYERLSPPRRALLHASLARAIEPNNRPELIESLAHHWAAAGEPARAIPYLIDAADHAAQIYANVDAIARLQRALALLDEISVTSSDLDIQRAAVLERLADLHALTGENEFARDHYERAAAFAELPVATIARLRRKAAQQAIFTGNLGGVETLLAQAKTDLAAEPEMDGDLERARLLVVQSQYYFLSHRFPQALAAAEESLHVAEAAKSATDIGRACEMAAMACLPLGEWRRGLEYEYRHASLADPTAAIRDAADVHICLSDYHLYVEPPADAARAFLNTLEEAERAGAPRSLALCHYYLGTMAYMRGRFSEAITRLTEAIRHYQDVESASGEAIALMVRGLAQTAIGQLEVGQQDLTRAVEAAQQGTLRSHGLIRVYAGLCRHYLEIQDPGSARQYAELGLSLADEPGGCICYAAVFPAAAAAFALTGDLDRAAGFGNSALAHAQALGSPYFTCLAYQANAVVHLMTGAWDAAFSALDEAQRYAEASSFPYEQGRTLLLRAFVHELRRTESDYAAASSLAAQAEPILQHLGVPTNRP